MDDKDRDPFGKLRVAPRDSRGDRFPDELLEASLARYSRVEPRPGLEERLLEQVRLAERRAPWFGWPGLAWASAAVLLVLGGVLYFAYHRSAPPATSPQVAVTPPAPPAAVPPPRQAAPRVERAAASQPARPAPQPQRREEFPSSAPLSVQERLLLAFVAENPVEVLTSSALVAQPLERVRIEPVKIRPTVIEPLPPKGGENQ